jgi:8-oxo-dGTP diphosphatase
MSAPSVGCGAAIFDAQGRVLLVLRRRPPEAGAWSFPGGKVDFGETCAEAAVRETREELGVDIALEGLMHLVEQIGPGPQDHWVSPVYRARLIAGAPAIQEPDKHAALGWFSPEALPTPHAIAVAQVFAHAP